MSTTEKKINGKFWFAVFLLCSLISVSSYAQTPNPQPPKVETRIPLKFEKPKPSLLASLKVPAPWEFAFCEVAPIGKNGTPLRLVFFTWHSAKDKFKKPPESGSGKLFIVQEFLTRAKAKRWIILKSLNLPYVSAKSRFVSEEPKLYWLNVKTKQGQVFWFDRTITAFPEGILSQRRVDQIFDSNLAAPKPIYYDIDGTDTKGFLQIGYDYIGMDGILYTGLDWRWDGQRWLNPFNEDGSERTSDAQTPTPQTPKDETRVPVKFEKPAPSLLDSLKVAAPWKFVFCEVAPLGKNGSDLRLVFFEWPIQTNKFQKVPDWGSGKLLVVQQSGTSAKTKKWKVLKFINLPFSYEATTLTPDGLPPTLYWLNSSTKQGHIFCCDRGNIELVVFPSGLLNDESFEQSFDSTSFGTNWSEFHVSRADSKGFLTMVQSGGMSTGEGWTDWAADEIWLWNGKGWSEEKELDK